MTGASLFPDDYPPLEARPRPVSCCADLVAPPGITPMTWTFLHALCHSRVPFTVARLMAITCSEELEAGIAIGEAKHRDWLHYVWPDTYMTDPLDQWVGCLPRRR